MIVTHHLHRTKEAPERISNDQQFTSFGVSSGGSRGCVSQRRVDAVCLRQEFSTSSIHGREPWLSTSSTHEFALFELLCSCTFCGSCDETTQEARYCIRNKPGSFPNTTATQSSVVLQDLEKHHVEENHISRVFNIWAAEETSLPTEFLSRAVNSHADRFCDPNPTSGR